IMDIYERRRAFQNPNMTSHQLINKVMGEYKNIKYKINVPNEPIGEFILQYNETDWEFLKRFLSRYNEGIMVSMQSGKPKVFFGPPEIEVKSKNHIKNYTVYKDLNRYNDMKNNYKKAIKDTDFITYRVKMNEIFNVGENLSHIGRKFYIKSLIYELKDSRLEAIYDLSPRGGLTEKRLYNSKVIGISINGSILGVNRDKVKVKLEIDNSSDNSYWFPYSTVAASPDGGGWYCMPEIGEKVRIYCPTKEEKKAIAISAIGSHNPKSKGKNDRMSNPSIKSLKTDSGQEVKFTPTGVLIECNGGNAKIELNKNGSVNVIGQKNINIACAEELSLRAENELSILGQKSIDILCESGSSLIMDESEEITFTGTRVHNNG
ncbi:phage baseplate assembly protein V, partial [Clostridium sp.]|uniref:contractile injection system protein, VgrG/Pvc8 family n=1 Tax=Clostridium sp. TaxID=1506 RepID=UPI003463ABED